MVCVCVCVSLTSKFTWVCEGISRLMYYLFTCKFVRSLLPVFMIDLSAPRYQIPTLKCLIVRARRPWNSWCVGWMWPLEGCPRLVIICIPLSVFVLIADSLCCSCSCCRHIMFLCSYFLFLFLLQSLCFWSSCSSPSSYVFFFLQTHYVLMFLYFSSCSSSFNILIFLHEVGQAMSLFHSWWS